MSEWRWVISSPYQSLYNRHIDINNSSIDNSRNNYMKRKKMITRFSGNPNGMTKRMHLTDDRNRKDEKH